MYSLVRRPMMRGPSGAAASARISSATEVVAKSGERRAMTTSALSAGRSAGGTDGLLALSVTAMPAACI